MQENEQIEIIPTFHDELEEARLEAEQIILTAKKEQKSINADLMQEKLNWEQEKVNLIKEAKEEGYQSRMERGRKPRVC